MNRKIIIASIFMITMISLVPKVSSTYHIDENVESMYHVNGTTEINSNTRIYDESLSVTIDTDGTFANVIFNYYITDLPYNVDKEIFILSSEQISSMEIDSTPITLTWEGYYMTWLGVPTLHATIVTTECTIKCIWDYRTGILFRAEIEKSGELRKALIIMLESTSINIYEGFSDSAMEQINLVKFIFSPVGAVLITMPFLLFFIIFVFIFAMSKRKRALTRGARVK